MILQPIHKNNKQSCRSGGILDKFFKMGYNDNELSEGRFGMKFEEAKKNANNKQKKLKNRSQKFITMQEYIKTFGSKEIKLPWGLQ